MSSRSSSPTPVARAPWRIAADIGGTFTDLVLVDPAGRSVAAGKILSRRRDPGSVVVEGVTALLRDAGLPAGELTDLVHGTTLVTNALIERSGAPTGLITTEGFRDVLEIGREARYDLHDLDIELPEPLVPRRWRVEVRERVLADGEERLALDLDGVRNAAARLRDEGVESVGVIFLHSYRHDRHERAAAEVIAEECPGMEVTTSCDVLPQMGEFARASTTAASAYVRPLVRGYLRSLEERVRELAGEAAVSLVTSSGHVTPLETAVEAPIRLLESGPAGGVLAAIAVARLAGAEDCLALDMGGTTAKASYVVGGRPRLSSSFEAARVRRFARGSGLPIQLPTIELIEIGAGGGSIASIDGLGLLRVGPRSAGSEPGPACYGFGGADPTVTDADLVLGYLGPESFLGGEMRLEPEAARRALASLGPDAPEEMAVSVRRVVDEQMAAAARMHAVEQGLDPRGFALAATGGAGPMHACSVARILGARRVVVPGRAGVASAHGFLGAPFGFEVARSAPALVSELDWSVTRPLLAELEAEARDAARGRATDAGRVEADLRYRGQGDVVTIPIDGAVVADGDSERLRQLLADEYRRRYDRVPEGVPAELLTWRVTVWGAQPALLPMAARSSGRARSERRVYFEELDRFVATPVVEPREATGEGPMIVEDRESTLVVPPGARVEVIDDCAMVVDL